MKRLQVSHVVIALLAASTVDLALMVPGGFVETRDFSAYPALVLGAFNVFLTMLGLGSLLLGVLIHRRARGFAIAVSIGIAYVAVYLLDLWHIFPVTPNPMSSLLATLEWVGTGLGAVLAAMAIVASRHRAPVAQHAPRPMLGPGALIALVVLALLIVAFATRAAMGIR